MPPRYHCGKDLPRCLLKMLPNPTSQVEVLPKFNPRAYFLAVSYAQGFSHYAYTRSGPKFWDYYDTARKLSWLNVTDLHGYVATALGDGEFHSAQ